MLRLDTFPARMVATSTTSLKSMPKRILVIDDAPATLRLLQVALARLDYEVVTHLTGESGLADINATIPDLVILDIALPDIDGWEILARMREDERTVNVPVLIISAHDTNDISGRADLTAASGFLGKPFPPHQLRTQVQRLLEDG